MPSFNLIDSPWILCVPRGGGEPKLLGLRETLVRAHHQRALLDDSPLVTVALHRLLLAIVHRVLDGPRTIPDWQALRAQGQFDAQRIIGYLERCRPFFDLFDATHPFYQVPWMEGVNTIAAAKLAHEKASGNNITLFDHTTGATGGLTPAQAARYLVAFQSFAGGGGVSQPFNLSDAPLARDYSVLVRGENLFETLLLNLVGYTEEVPIPRHGDDPPAWERNGSREPQREGTIPDGYLDYLTWQSRRVHMLYDESTGLVRECQIRQNLKLASGVFDPFKPYYVSKEGGWRSTRLSEDKAIWRDSHALLEAASSAIQKESRRPAVFDWLMGIQQENLEMDDSHQYSFDVLGSLNDGAQATIILWRHDRLPLPLPYLTDRALWDWLRDALDLAEKVSRLFMPRSVGSGQKSYAPPLRLLAENLLTGTAQRKPDDRDITNLITHFGAERAYWAALEPRFRGFMVKLAEAGGEEGAREPLGEWAKDVEICAGRAFGAIWESLDTGKNTFKAWTQAEHAFNRQRAGMLAKFRESYGIAQHPRATQEALA